jgi:hypothetical protein
VSNPRQLVSKTAVSGWLTSSLPMPKNGVRREIFGRLLSLDLPVDYQSADSIYGSGPSWLERTGAMVLERSGNRNAESIREPFVTAIRSISD